MNCFIKIAAVMSQKNINVNMLEIFDTVTSPVSGIKIRDRQASNAIKKWEYALFYVMKKSWEGHEKVVVSQGERSLPVGL
jgi:hypothetical protein